MGAGGQFRRRILLVDGDSDFLQACSKELRRQSFEVLTADDGFAALHVLRGAQPDLLIADLNLPRMSGFELLSVVRTRFPAISVIAVSSDYTGVTLPQEVICDAYLTKGPKTPFEIVAELRRVISDSPIRPSRVKSDLAPVWVSRSTVGYIILTCPECLRSFSAAEPQSSPASDTCIFCGALVRFQMSSVGRAPAPPPDTVVQRSRKVREQAREVVARSRKIRGTPRSSR